MFIVPETMVDETHLRYLNYLDHTYFERMDILLACDNWSDNFQGRLIFIDSLRRNIQQFQDVWIWKCSITAWIFWSIPETSVCVGQHVWNTRGMGDASANLPQCGSRVGMSRVFQQCFYLIQFIIEFQHYITQRAMHRKWFHLSRGSVQWGSQHNSQWGMTNRR